MHSLGESPACNNGTPPPFMTTPTGQPEADAVAASPVLYSLVKVCGSGMMVETPETKVQLVQHMWKVLKDSGELGGGAKVVM